MRPAGYRQIGKQGAGFPGARQLARYPVHPNADASKEIKLQQHPSPSLEAHRRRHGALHFYAYCEEFPR
jgi:hypothetical protein